MLELITSSGSIPIHDTDSDHAITHKWNGIDTLHFEISLDDPVFPSLAEEAYIYESTEGQTYVIKGIDAGSSSADVDCELNLEAWQASATFYYYNNTSSLPVTMQEIVPAGWSMVYQTMDSQRRSVLLDAGGTPLDIALTAQDSYGCAMRFDTKQRTCTVYYPQTHALSGTLLTEGVAMQQRPSRTGKSTDLVTRVYPIGADGLSIEAVNGGKSYVENHSYTDKVICKVWKDERYEDAESLLADAQLLVDSLAVPEVAWEVSLFDLYRSNPQRWGDHKVELYQRVRVAYNGSTITALIVAEEVHPNHPENNTVAVNSVPGNSISTIAGLKDAVQNPNSSFNAEKAAAIENATRLISGSRGGHVVTVLDGDGKPQEICILTDTEDISTAQSLWRWNEGGLGHSDSGYNGPFTMALTKDGAIVADRITVGTLNAGIVKAGILSDGQNRNYWNLETGEFRLSAAASVGGSTVSEIANSAASSAAGSALDSAKGYADGKLGEAKDYASAAAGSAAAAAMAEYDSVLNQQKVFQKLTGGQTQGIYLTDGRLYINGSYIKTGVLDAGSITMSGRLFTRNGSSDENSGYIGYMEGSTGTAVTKGIGVSNRAGDCFAIATEAGVRLQAGDYSMFVTKTGTAAIRAGAGSLTIETEGSMGPGLYYTGSIFAKNSQGTWYQVT